MSYEYQANIEIGASDFGLFLERTQRTLPIPTTRDGHCLLTPNQPPTATIEIGPDGVYAAIDADRTLREAILRVVEGVLSELGYDVEFEEL